MTKHDRKAADAAASAIPASAAQAGPAEPSAALVRVLRALARRGAYATLPSGAALEGAPPAETAIVLSPRNGYAAPVARTTAAELAAAVAAGLVVAGMAGRWALAPEGALRLRAKAASAAKDGPRRRGRPPKSRAPGAPVPEAVTAGARPHETPLAWLATRKDKDGRPLVSPAQVEAAERLAADFFRAQMLPRVTSSWSELPASGAARRGAPGAGVEMSDGAAAARARVGRALAAVGRELAGVLVDLCGHDQGLEAIGRARGWPARSAKVVVDIALTALARHYGLIGDGDDVQARARIRHWGGPGYRPSLAQWDGGDESGG